MLVLTRKVQEQIKVGNDITITIIRVKGQSVRVGIEAPRDVRVMRSELAEASELTHETDASVPTAREESLVPNPEQPESSLPAGNRLAEAEGKTTGHVVGPRRVTAPRTGPLSKRVVRQTVVDMLELAR